MDRNAKQAAEWAARNSYGRLVAYLAVRSRDVAAAEDALSEAFLAALKTWPDQGVPAKPEAWLLTTARRRLIDSARRRQTQANVVNSGELATMELPEALGEEGATFSDERLKLLFCCAHPAIKPQLHTPLMLQTVLGFNAVQIGSAFLVAPTTMGQRLVRAKAKIRDAGIPFTVPDSSDLPHRLDAVLQAIYAIYTSGWDELEGSDPRPRGLAQEAIWLARLCAELMPQEPEVLGLLALMLFCESRRPARRSTDGAYVPLSEQNVKLWSQPMMAEAEQVLHQAASCQQLGRFQLEAAIQSLHAARFKTKTIDWTALVQLYAGLIQRSPTIGAFVGQAAAIAKAQSPAQGLQQLDALPAARVKNYQPYWALRAHLLGQLGQMNDARRAYSKAIGLAEDPAIVGFFRRKRLQ